jgi:hypothetical protein
MAAPRAAIQEYPLNVAQNRPEIANEIVAKTIVRMVRISAILIMNLRNPRIFFGPPTNFPTFGGIAKIKGRPEDRSVTVLLSGIAPSKTSGLRSLTIRQDRTYSLIGPCCAATAMTAAAWLGSCPASGGSEKCPRQARAGTVNV